MFLDLWSLAILTGDLLELIVNHIESGTLAVSLPFLAFLVVIVTISCIAWRSTYIPDLPPVPRPPYVIQILATQSGLNIGNGDRNSLSDIRLISTGADVENVLRRFPSSQGAFRSQTTQLPNRNSSGTGSASVPVRQAVRTVRVYPIQSHQHEAQRPGGSSVFLGLLRPGSVIRPLIANRANGAGTQSRNLIVYHRVNVYHHHHHHHHDPVSNSSNGLPAADGSQTPLSSQTESSSAFQSVDSATQYETIDPLLAASIVEQPSTELEDGLIPTASTSLNSSSQELEEDIRIESDNQTASLAEDFNVPLAFATSRGLRHRIRSAAQGTGSINPDSLTASSIRQVNNNAVDINMADNRDNNAGNEKNQNDQAAGSQQQTPIPPEVIDDIRFTIKFLNDTQMEVTSQLNENILDFKRRLFAAELSDNKTVRLIFNGRVLDNDTTTLRESGIFDQCVVHCLIVARPATASPITPGASGSSIQLNQNRRSAGLIRAPEPGMFFVAFVGVFLIFLWFICFHFGQHLFTQSAVVSLTILTAIFLIGLVAFYLPVHPN